MAGRLAENPNVKILLVEAGQHNKDLENVHMVGGLVALPMSFQLYTNSESTAGPTTSTPKQTGTSSHPR